MITLEQAIYANEFHYDHPAPKTGPRGGIHYPRVEIWRRNGKTKTWKTRPGEFRIPVKFGLYRYGYITQNDAKNFHVKEECNFNSVRIPGFDFVTR